MLVGIFFLIVVSSKGPTDNRLPRNEWGGGAVEAFYRETVMSEVGETSFLWWTWRRQTKVNDSQSFFQVRDQGYIFQLVLLTHAWTKLWSFVLVSPVCYHINRIVNTLFLEESQKENSMLHPLWCQLCEESIFCNPTDLGEDRGWRWRRPSMFPIIFFSPNKVDCGLADWEHFPFMNQISLAATESTHLKYSRISISQSVFHPFPNVSCKKTISEYVVSCFFLSRAYSTWLIIHQAPIE